VLRSCGGADGALVVGASCSPTRTLITAQVSIGIDPMEIFAGADWALMVGASPRGPGMERADLIQVTEVSVPDKSFFYKREQDCIKDYQYATSEV